MISFEKLGVLWLMVGTPLICSLSAFAMYDPKLAGPSIFMGLVLGVVTMVAFTGISFLYAMGVRFLCRRDNR